MQLLAFLGALALLIGNTTAGLASRLAGGLALATTAVLGAVAQIAGLNGLDMFHSFTFCMKEFLLYNFNTQHYQCQSYFSYFSRKHAPISLVKIPK